MIPITSIKYDVTGVEPGQDFSEPMPVNTYLCEVLDCQEGTSKQGNEQINLTLSVIKATSGDKPEKYKGRRLWDYIGLGDSTAWKMRQFLEAIGKISDNGKGEKGSLNLNSIIGKKLLVKTTNQSSEEYGTRSKVATLMALRGDVDEEPEDEEPEDEAEGEEPEDEEELLTMEELEAYDRDEMKQLIKDNDLGIRVTKSTSDDRLRERIAEELGIEAEDEEPEDEEPEDEEGEGEMPDDYNEWDLPDLKAEAKERGLQSGGTKKTLVKRLEKDDKDDAEPF